MNEQKREDSFETWRQIAIIAWSILGLLLLVVSLFYLVYLIRSILPPFIYAAAIVYLLRPTIDYLEEKGISRLLALFLTYLVLTLIVALLLLFIVPKIVNEMASLGRALPGYFSQGQKFIYQYQDKFKRFRIPKEANLILTEVLNKVKDSLIQIFSGLAGATINLVGTIFYFILAPIIAFYILKDLEYIKNSVKNLIPARHRQETLAILRKVDAVLGGFVRGQLTEAIIVGILSSIGLLILGVDFAIIIGMVAGFFDLIPYMGPVIGALPAITVALLKSSPWLALKVIVMFIIIQQMDSFIIYPNVMKRQVGLHPVLVILSLLAGGVLFGFLGMLIAIPLAAVGKALIDHFLDRGGL